MVEKIYLDELFRIKLSNLKKCGKNDKNLRLQKCNAFGEIIEELNVSVVFKEFSRKMILAYNTDGNAKIQTIDLVEVKSNIDQRHYHLAICPVTGAKCLKLYFFNGKFVGRKAIENAGYTSQIYNSERQSAIIQRLGRKIKKVDRLTQELEAYKGRSRIKRVRLINKIQLLKNQIA